MNKKIEELLLIHEIQDMANTLGRVPKKNEFPKTDQAIELFGSWPEALARAGYPRQTRLPDDTLKEIYRKRKEELGRVPKTTEFQPYYQVLLRRFGSWKEALSFLDEEEKTNQRQRDIEKIQSFYAKHGRPPERADFPDNVAIGKRLGNGNWGRTLQAAGLDQVVVYNLSKADIVNIIKEKAAELGHPPTAADIPQSFTAIRRFGSWNNALREAGITVWKKNHNSHAIITNKELLFELQLLIVSKNGKRPHYREFARRGLAVKRFKKWSTAIDTALSDPYGTMEKAEQTWKNSTI